MSKKDFSQDSEDVFSSMFSINTIKEAEKKEEVKPKKEEKKETNKVVEKKVEIKKEIKEEKQKIDNPIVSITEKKQKIFENKYRYSFYADPLVNEYLSNISWIKRTKGIPPYLNSLIKADLLNFLKLNSSATDEEIENAWNNYKKENNF